MSTFTQLGDRYDVGQVIGRGGMAEVYEGTDRRLNRRVAIKVLRPDWLEILCSKNGFVEKRVLRPV